MIEYRAILQKAFAGESVEISCADNSDANSLRQKFYRYRDKLRESNDELNIIVDGLRFELDGNKLVISYNNLENLVEALNDNENTGGRTLNLEERRKPESAQRRVR